MPLSKYSRPQRFRELEVLRTEEVAREHRDCPDCGGEILRVPSRFGSKTGSSLQPSGAQFRSEFASSPSGRAGVATATLEDAVRAESRFELGLTGVAVDVPSNVDSQLNSSNASPAHKGGIASLLKHFRRRDGYVKHAGKVQYPEVAVCTKAAEDSLYPAPGADQQIWYPSVRSCSEDRLAGPVGVTESVITWPNQPVEFPEKQWWPASFVMQWPEENAQAAVPVQPGVRPWVEHRTTAAGQLWPRSSFEWFLLVTVVQALTVVPLVWILAVVVF